MDPLTSAALIGVGGSIASGILSGRSSGSANKDRRLQKKFAKNQIRWRVEDAKSAGLHPLAALGAPTASPSPTSVGGGKSDYGLGNASQEIARAIGKRKTPEERAAYQQALANEKLRGQKTQAEINLINQTIRNMDSEIAGPPEPTPSMKPGSLPGQMDEIHGKDPLTILTKPQQTVIQEPGLAAGTNPAEQEVMVGNKLFRTPTQQFSEQASEDPTTKVRYGSIKLKQAIDTYALYRIPTLKDKYATSANSYKARAKYHRLRQERAGLPKVRYKIWQLAPKTQTWTLVPKTATNLKHFWTDKKHPEPYNLKRR